VLAALVLVALAAFSPMLRSTGVSQSAVFLDRTDAVVGQDVVARHFPSGAGDPVVIMARRDSAGKAAKAVRAVHGVAGVAVGTEMVAGDVEIDATLTSPTDSAAAT